MQISSLLLTGAAPSTYSAQGPAEFIIFNTMILVFNTECLVFDTQFHVFNAKVTSFSFTSRKWPRSSMATAAWKGATFSQS